MREAASGGRQSRRSPGTAVGGRAGRDDGTSLAARALALQRAAGNRATSLVLQAQAEAPAAVVIIPGQAVPELLDAGAIERAKAFYRARPKRYTPAVMEELHAHFELPPSDQPTTGMVEHVAVVQKRLGLKVDGKAGPRTLPQIFQSGLQRGEQAREYAGKADELAAEWDRAPLLRAHTIVSAANERLAAAEVPACSPGVVDLGTAVLGQFEHASWTIFIDDDLVAGPSVDPATGKSRIKPAMADVYHEARHAEQWFWMARMLAGRTPTPSVDQLAKRAEIPGPIAERALGKPFPPGTTEAAIAEGWFDAELGSRRADTKRARDRAQAAREAQFKAEQVARDDPTEANQARAAAAKRRADALFAIYRDIPTEGDAFRAERKVEEELELT